ncbi:hypothetical protein, partial [Campylobacter jejuni]|uniref:hypothetical protein n=1 Tax=Campylobacter jejuni TaxID=197 RepID=UPI001A8F990B
YTHSNKGKGLFCRYGFVKNTSTLSLKNLKFRYNLTKRLLCRFIVSLCCNFPLELQLKADFLL